MNNCSCEKQRGDIMTHKHDHAHDHGHHHHHGGGKRIGITILLNLFITVSQVIGGFMSGSLSLLTDAAHNFSDVIALVISYIANKLSGKKYTANKTFGFKRAEIIAALINVISIIVIAILIFIEAIERIGQTPEIKGVMVMALAGLSILLNGASVLIIQKDAKDNINIKSAYLHLFSDMLTSIAVLIGGALMYYYQMYWVDTLLSIGIAIYLIYVSIQMLLETLSILMQFAPPNINLDQLTDRLCQNDFVKNIHHIHAWQLTDREIHFEAHVAFNDDLSLSLLEKGLDSLKNEIRKSGFTHITLEPELDKCADPKRIADCGTPTE